VVPVHIRLITRGHHPVDQAEEDLQEVPAILVPAVDQEVLAVQAVAGQGDNFNETFFSPL
jgi:hypothetical protein